MLTARPDQADFRQSVTYIDQHGRSWQTVLDTQARTSGKKPRVSPCVPFAPYDWSAPLDVPQKYLTIPEGSIGKVVIDYDAWLEDAYASERDRNENIRIAAMTMYSTQASAAIKNPPPELLAYIGRGPIPVKFIQAAKSGKSRWVLGLRQENGLPYPADYVPEWACPIIDQLRPTTAPVVDDEDFVDSEVEFSDDVPALAAPLDDETEQRLDLEEEADPDAVGGKVEPVRAGGKPRGKRAA